MSAASHTKERDPWQLLSFIQTFMQHLLWHFESVGGDKICVPRVSLIHLCCIDYGELWNKGTHGKCMTFSLLPKSGLVFLFHGSPLVLYR